MKFKGTLIVLCLFALTINNPAMGQEQADVLAIRAGFAQALDEQNADKAKSFFADDGVFDYVVLPIPLLESKEVIGAYYADLFNGSPDFHTTDGRVLSAGNIVVVEHSAVGTNTGESSIPATGKPWTLPHIDIYEIEGEKIKRLTTFTDYASVFVQLGFAPAPEPIELSISNELPDPEPTGLSPLEANADHIQRWSSHDAASVAKIYDTDMQMFAGPLGAALDRSAMTAMNEMYFVGFPDANLKTIRPIDLGDGWVVTELLATGTHQGPFMGIPPMGYPTETRLVWLMHYSADGLVTEGSFYYDNLTLMTQMTEAPYSPVGTWVVTVPTPFGNQTLLHTINPSVKTGGACAGTISTVNESPTFFGAFPEADGSSDWITQTISTGMNTFQTTMMVYATQKGDGPLSKTVLISIGYVTWTITGPDTNMGSTLYCVYRAEQDADGDGFPDEGQEPVLTETFTFTSRRFTVMSPPMVLPATP